MDPIERLTALFERFPGIGPRQAGRFVHYLMRAPASVRKEIAEAVRALSGSARVCESCLRFHTSETALCTICQSPTRDASLLAIVAGDADLAALERSGFRGFYFVFGGTMSLASEKKNGLHGAELLTSIPRRVAKGLKEIILAFPANPEGDFTASHVKSEVEPFAAKHALKITTLGRGLSTGSELEYADPDTIKSALDNRR